MADKPPGKSAVSSRDPRLVYRPIETSTTTPPTAGGTPLVPAGTLTPERGERGPRQVGGKSRRSSSEEEEQKPRKRLDTANTPSPSDPEEGGREKIASTCATSGTEGSDSESSTSSADTTPSRSTSYVEPESRRESRRHQPWKQGHFNRRWEHRSCSRKRRASVPPPPSRGRKTAEKRPPRPTRAERRRAQAPLPPETAHPQLAPTPAEIPQERGGGGATLAMMANDPTDRHAPPSAAQEATQGGAQAPPTRANRRTGGGAAIEPRPNARPMRELRKLRAKNATNSVDGCTPTTRPSRAGVGWPSNRKVHQEATEVGVGCQAGAPVQPERQPLPSQLLPQRQPRSRTRRTATPAAPTITYHNKFRRDRRQGPAADHSPTSGSYGDVLRGPDGTDLHNRRRGRSQGGGDSHPAQSDN
ncbi:hypothetical protein K1T71_014564 [Dendrolimus kikuchii]|uniref:Uncharacterized protein n=1 Tax=Dendrolimus kikuchii TaxID=765133 RepID=A0ACC1CEH1_9NEOP|nr:hypothetical protein K1T71_014564 [Dendrolimus kikuchii]